jgi:bacteriocin biosynthesis cyclodehydratase domain-containing protein
MPDGLGIQFRGAETPILIRGRLAEPIITFLISKLDGSLTLNELLEICPSAIRSDTLLEALWHLYSKGLLIDASLATSLDSGSLGVSPPINGDDILPRQLLFWGRHLDVTRSAHSSTEVQRRLGTARLVLVATGMFGIATYDLLSRSGFSHVRVLDWNDDGLLDQTLRRHPTPPQDQVHLSVTSIDTVASYLRPWTRDADLLLTATCEAPAELFRTLNRLCLLHGCPWLRSNVDGSRVELGPYVVPYDSGCYRCMELRQSSVQAFAIEEYLYQQHLAQEREAIERKPLGEAVWSSTLAAALLVGEIVRVISGIAPPTLLNGVMEIRPVTGSLRTNRFLRVPRCPDCYRGEIMPHPVVRRKEYGE